MKTQPSTRWIQFVVIAVVSTFFNLSEARAQEPLVVGSLPDAQTWEGRELEPLPFSVTGGVQPYTFEILPGFLGGTVPSGLDVVEHVGDENYALVSDGRFSDDSADGDDPAGYIYVVAVTDSSSPPQTRYSDISLLTINPEVDLLVGVSGSLSGHTVGIESPLVSVVAFGGKGRLTWSASGLPPGFELHHPRDPDQNDVDGSAYITILPEQYGQYFDVTITVTDGDGQVFTKFVNEIGGGDPDDPSPPSIAPVTVHPSPFPPTILVGGGVSSPEVSLLNAMEGVDYVSSPRLLAGSVQGEPIWSVDPLAPLPEGLAIVPVSAGGLSGFGLEIRGRLELGTASDAPYLSRVILEDTATELATSIDVALQILEYLEPIAVASPFILPDAIVGAPYTSTIDVENGQGPFAWLVLDELPTGLVFDNGVLSGVPSPQALGRWEFDLRVNGAGTGINNNVRETFFLEVIASDLIVSTNSLPNAYPGRSYSASLEAQGGSGSYRWSLENSTLPAGLELANPAQVGAWQIVGSPDSDTASSEPYSVTLRVEDILLPTVEVSPGVVAPRVAVITFPLLVLPRVTVLTSNAPLAVVGQAYELQLRSIGGIEPYSYEAPSLPDGLMIESARAGADESFVVGVPSADAVGSHIVDIVASDSDTPPQRGLTRLSIVVSDGEGADLVITTSYLPPTQVGEAYKPLQLDVANGEGVDVSWAASGLPQGLSLVSSGVLFGQVDDEPGEYRVQVEVIETSSLEVVDSVSLLLVVMAAPTLPNDAVESLQSFDTGQLLSGSPAGACTLVSSSSRQHLLALLLCLLLIIGRQSGIATTRS